MILNLSKMVDILTSSNQKIMMVMLKIGLKQTFGGDEEIEHMKQRLLMRVERKEFKLLKDSGYEFDDPKRL